MAESPRGDFDRPGPSKRSSRDCKYQQEWQSHGMLPSMKGPGFGLCKYCNTDINIAHGAVYEEIVKAVGSSRNVREFFQPLPIERAEVLFSNFVAEHNIPLMTTDHFTNLTSMFPDSKIAQAFRCPNKDNMHCEWSTSLTFC